MKFFSDLAGSFLNFNAYRRFTQKNGRRVFGYIFLTTIFTFTLFSIINIIKMGLMPGVLTKRISDVTPYFCLENGHLKVDDKIKIDNKAEGGVFIYISTSDVYTQDTGAGDYDIIYKYDSVILVDSENIYIKMGDSLKHTPNSDLTMKVGSEHKDTVSKEEIFKVIDSWYIYLYLSIAVLILIFGFLWTLYICIISLMFSAFGTIISTVCGERLDYMDIYKMDIYAQTPFFIIFLLFSAVISVNPTGLVIRTVFFAGIVIHYLIFVLAVLDFKKNGFNPEMYADYDDNRRYRYNDQYYAGNDQYYNRRNYPDTSARHNKEYGMPYDGYDDKSYYSQEQGYNDGYYRPRQDGYDNRDNRGYYNQEQGYDDSRYNHQQSGHGYSKRGYDSVQSGQSLKSGYNRTGHEGNNTLNRYSPDAADEEGRGGTGKTFNYSHGNTVYKQTDIGRGPYRGSQERYGYGQEYFDNAAGRQPRQRQNPQEQYNVSRGLPDQGHMQNDFNNAGQAGPYPGISEDSLRKGQAPDTESDADRQKKGDLKSNDGWSFGNIDLEK